MNIVYFAYGSNMDKDQMAHRCLDSIFAGIAMLEGYRFIINSRSVATVVQDPPSVVYGALWNLSPADEARLDVYEGVADGLYSKEYITIRPSGNDSPEQQAMVYIAADRIPGKSRIGYIGKIIAAAEKSQFPKFYIDSLKKWQADK